ncbi:hypothetical protein [Microvirga massiliensis]|uniref:hypothetical protein n=1 Tax=Microvirga massiliensis TaxID=1033741 RepID=UPI00062BD06D|nr:hypothetical protein [Microvirga massiliensis]
MLSSVSPEAGTTDSDQDRPRTEAGYSISSEVRRQGTESNVIAEPGGQTGQSTNAGTQIQGHPGTPERDWSVLLGPLTSSPESRELAARLEARLLARDSNSAELLLVSAVEVGTLASLMLDRLDDPSLVAFLQSLRLAHQEQARSDPKAVVDNSVAGQSEEHDYALVKANAASDLSQAQEAALRQVHAQVVTLAHELAAARRELEASNQRSSQIETSLIEARRIDEERILEHRTTLERERARADALAQALTEARQANETATQQGAGLSVSAANADTARARVTEQRTALMSSALAQHRARADALTQELAAMRQELERTRTQKLILDQERSRADGLARELASARQELEASKSGNLPPEESRNNSRALLLRAFEHVRTWRQDQAPTPHKRQSGSDASQLDR